jgi:hypothetical protein
MKKMIFSMLALFAAVPAIASEPVQLSGLGLSDLQQVSEETGLQVRGLSSNAHSSGLTTIRAFAIDPSTGATFNANASNFARSSQDGTVGFEGSLGSTASSNTFAGFNDLTFEIGLGESTGFGVRLDGAAASSGVGTTLFDGGFIFSQSGFSLDFFGDF